MNVPTKATSAAQVPAELIGKWRVARELRTNNITCWDDKQAHTLIGTEIEYGKDSLQWGKTHLKVQHVRKATFDAEQFLREYSGSGGGVRFHDLGVVTPTVNVLQIQHADIEWKDSNGNAQYEIPGDWALLRDRNSIVISVCSVYFEAQRVTPHVPALP
jgi:hypothetical protein